MKTVTICIPCYNEARTIGELVRRVRRADTCGLKKEIILVDDGSADETEKVLDKYIKSKKIRYIKLSPNRGKGFAIKTAWKVSRGDIVINQDADLEYDPTDYPLLLSPILKGGADVVYGSRFMGGRPHRVVYYWHSVMNSFLTMFSNMLTNINLTDMETCYKVVKGRIARKIAKNLKSNRFGFEPEVTARLSKIKDIRFYEVGISYYGRTYGEGKHINWLDGLKAIWQIFYYNVFG
ncbi:glycosyltransferase family 2 protein [Candidatus Shapirobacteria bacterium]|nr:glycosyltransferase family 2 protein [Candidatus Shapirobacteria bacterium]